jgi:NHL repeat
VSAHPYRLRCLLSLSSAFALMLGLITLCAGAAWAEPPKLIQDGSFGAGDVLTEGVTVDQSTGEVYVASAVSNTLTSFGHLDKFGVGGELLSPSPFAEGLNTGVAVNPVDGDVYVLEGLDFATGKPEIATYDPVTGKSVAPNFPVARSNNFYVGGLTRVQIAADAAGDVYVPVVPENEVLEYSPTGAVLNTFTGGAGAGALQGPTGVAIDSSGNLWVADAGNNRIEELSATGTPSGEIKSVGVESLALDGRGDVFALVRNSADFCGAVKAPCSHLVEYGSAGVQTADVGAGLFEAGSDAPDGLSFSAVAVDESSGRVYITDSSHEVVWIFGPPTAPIVSKELTAEVTTSEAKLGALVNPGGIPTSYRFEYGTSSDYGQSTPFPEGSAGEGIAAHAVWAAASALAPDTTYHYRVVASNELGTVDGPDQTFTTQTAAQAACPNAEFRSGFSVRLPDCRAYELVTPSTTTASQLRSAGPAAADGDALAFETQEPLPNSPTGGSDYLVTRGAGGWTAENVTPLESYSGILCVTEGQAAPIYSADMSKAVIGYGHHSSASQGNPTTYECNAEGLQVVPGEPVGYENLLLRDDSTGAYRLINAPPPGVTPANAYFKGASPDLSHVFFSEMAPLAEGALYGVENLFEWDEGALHLLTVLPNETAVAGSLAEGQQAENGRQAISTDGSHVLFTFAGGLYDRIDGQRTVQVDEAQGKSGSSGGGSLQAASADGSRVLFLDESRLTADSTAQPGEPDLYECVLPAGASRCELADLTVAGAGEHADVLRASGFGSSDSSHVYFLAKGVLAANKREYTDSQGQTVIERAKRGEDNLYLEQGGTITFIATLFPGDYGVGAVSPDGAWFAFKSIRSLTGYDNAEAHGAAPEIFLYDAATGGLECASCNPSGEAPIGGANLPPFEDHPLANGGRVLFDSEEALVPSDTNSRMDVYEYEDGQPFLISSGTSPVESSFVDATEDGLDVFFRTTQQLAPQDTNEDANVVYDARVDGGFPAIAAPPACTTADACRTPVSPQPSIYGAPSSQTFLGVGNLAPAVEAKPKATTKKLKAKRPKRPKRMCGRRKGRGPVRCVSSAHRTAKTAKPRKGGK